MIGANKLVLNFALLFPNKGAKPRLRCIKTKKIQIIPWSLELDPLFRISEAKLETSLLNKEQVFIRRIYYPRSRHLQLPVRDCQIFGPM